MSEASDLTDPVKVRALIERNRAELERTLIYLPLLEQTFGGEAVKNTRMYRALLTDNSATLEALLAREPDPDGTEEVDTRTHLVTTDQFEDIADDLVNEVGNAANKFRERRRQLFERIRKG